MNRKITYDSLIIIKTLHYLPRYSIRLSEKCFSFTDPSFATMHLYKNMKPNLSDVVIFILIEQNGS